MMPSARAYLLKSVCICACMCVCPIWCPFKEKDSSLQMCVGLQKPNAMTICLDFLQLIGSMVQGYHRP